MRLMPRSIPFYTFIPFYVIATNVCVAVHFRLKLKVLHDYTAQDLDEISLKEGSLVDLIKEGLQLSFN